MCEIEDLSAPKILQIGIFIALGPYNWPPKEHSTLLWLICSEQIHTTSLHAIIALDTRTAYSQTTQASKQAMQGFNMR